MSQPPTTFHLTRRAAIDLRDIHAHSRQRWGLDTADRYVADLYAVMGRAAAMPDIGLLRQHRSSPFLMVPARQHFIIYDRIPAGIAIVTLLHQVRDIESLIASLSPSFLKEIERMKQAPPAR